MGKRVTAVSYHDTVNDLQGQAFAGSGPFGRPEWFTLLERSGVRPFVALVQEGEQAVALCLTRQGTTLAPLTNWYAFTWSPLATSEAAREALLPHLASELGRCSTQITLSKLPDEDGTATLLERALRAGGWLVMREPCDTNHCLAVGGRAYGEYLAARPGALRTTLKRKARKVAIEIQTTFDAQAWSLYEGIYRESWKPEEGDPELLRRFASAEGAAGRLRLGLARCEGEPVAAQLWTVENGTAYIHKLAHLEHSRGLSPGTTLTAALLEHVIDRDRVACVDFGTGDDPYKRNWMEQVRPRYRLIAWRPGAVRNWPAIARAFVHKLVSRPTAG
jgi:hypothetical protein